MEMDDGRGCALGKIEQMIRYAIWQSGLDSIVIGISGGIDSSVAAALCCRAIGGKRILGLTLPTRVTHPDDIRDAAEFCRSLGINHQVIPIDPILEAYRGIPGFVESPYLTGNLMARTRMAILYYHANRDRGLVCGTSNRTEYMLGYCTKYGDNAADLQPILHLYKTEIYDIAGDLQIPAAIVKKVPSAGLWAGQSDEAEIGLSYPEIDAALQGLEKNNWKSRTGHEEKVLSIVRKSEHKRLGPPSLMGAL
jgi:NAD+ synthase